MGKLTFIIGGARSGKSNYAVSLAKATGGRIAFIATGAAADREMKKRISRHKQARPRQWKTFECTTGVDRLLRKIGGDFDLIILDCLTLLVSNIMLKTGRAIQAEREVSRICGILRKTKLKAVIVSNEVGLGIVPDNPLARQFRDTAGRVNQTVARFADEVVLMFCGLPMRLNKDNE